MTLAFLYELNNIFFPFATINFSLFNSWSEKEVKNWWFFLKKSLFFQPQKYVHKVLAIFFLILLIDYKHLFIFISVRALLPRYFYSEESFKGKNFRGPLKWYFCTMFIQNCSFLSKANNWYFIIKKQIMCIF